MLWTMTSCAESLFSGSRNPGLTNFKFIKRKLWPPSEEDYPRSCIADGWRSPKPKSLSAVLKQRCPGRERPACCYSAWLAVARSPVPPTWLHRLASFTPTGWTAVLYLKEVGGSINSKQDGLFLMARTICRFN